VVFARFHSDFDGEIQFDLIGFGLEFEFFPISKDIDVAGSEDTDTLP